MDNLSVMELETVIANEISRNAANIREHLETARERAEHIIEYIEGGKRCFAFGYDKKAGTMRDYSEKEYRALKAAGKIFLDL